MAGEDLSDFEHVLLLDAVAHLRADVIAHLDDEDPDCVWDRDVAWLNVCDSFDGMDKAGFSNVDAYQRHVLLEALTLWHHDLVDWAIDLVLAAAGGSDLALNVYGGLVRCDQLAKRFAAAAT